MNKELPNCPVCGSKMKRIIYGMVASMPDDPNVVLGGCMLDGDSPDFACPKCDAEDYNFEMFSQTEQE
jgi:rubrerythrin